MKAFLITNLVLFSLGIVLYLFILATAQYPRDKKLTRADDAWRVAWYIGAVIWILFLLVRS